MEKLSMLSYSSLYLFCFVFVTLIMLLEMILNCRVLYCKQCYEIVQNNMLSRQKIKRKYFSSLCQYNYNNKLESLINRQIQLEEQAAQDYLNIAVYFRHPSVSRPGTGGYFMNMYEEEIGHMLTFINYQLLRGGKVEVPSLNQPTKFTKLSICEAFNKGLSMEKDITKMLEEIVSQAEQVKDYQCADYVTSVFLDDQIKSINEFCQHLTKIDRFSKDEHALYQYDLYLAKAHPYESKIKLHN